MDRKYKTMSFEAAGELMKCETDYILLDVREDYEYVTGHAEGARNLSINDISAETADEVIPSKSTIVLTYCKSGKRSFLAMQKLKELGYEHVESLGSLMGWPYGISYDEDY